MKLRTLINVIMVAAAALLLFFFTMPAYREGQEAERTIPQREEELRREQQLQQRIADLRDRLSDLEGQAVVLEQLLPTEPSVPSFVEEMEQLADQSGMVLRELGVSQSAGSTNARSARSRRGTRNGAGATGPEVPLAVSISASGTYDAFKQFLQILENHERLINVKVVSTGETVIGDPAAAGTVTDFTISAETYYLE